MKSLIVLPPSTHSLKQIQIRCIFYSVGTKEKKNLKTKYKKGLLHKNVSPSQLTCRWGVSRMAECVIRSDGRVVYKRCPIKCEARARVGRNRLLCITRIYPKAVRLLQSIPKSPTTKRIHYSIICKQPQPHKVLRRRPWKQTCFSEWESLVGWQGRFRHRPCCKNVWETRSLYIKTPNTILNAGVP